MVYDKPITIQKADEATEAWADWLTLHARVNKSKGSEYQGAGANQSKSTRVFEVRYLKALEEIDQNRGAYRLIYRDHPYNITDYDDYLEQHKTVKLLGVSY